MAGTAWRWRCLESFTAGLWGWRARAVRACSWCCRLALAALLTRLGAGFDIPIGSPIAGRTDAALDDLVGFFVNTLVLRTDSSGDPSLRALIGRVRSRNLSAYSHQELPFERLVEVLNPARSLSRHPLFQVMLVLQNTAPARLELAGLAVSAYPLPAGGAKFDLSLSLLEQRSADGTPAGISGVLEYATDLFDRSGMEGLAERLVRLLEAALLAPDRPIGRLDILSAAERRTLLTEWNATGRVLPAATLPQLFAAQAAKTPAAAAVVCDAGTLSYGELELRANQLAHHLRALGVGPEVVVGLCVERSPAMIVALIAILKAGGAYLPLDPDYPRERLAFMLADAGAPVLVTQSTLLDRLPAHDARLVQLDADAALIAQQPEHAPAVALDPQHPAYVIYTSGSTGSPKGVVVAHRGIPNLAAAQIDHLAITSAAHVLQFASLSFDAAIWEICDGLWQQVPPWSCSGQAQRGADGLARLIRQDTGSRTPPCRRCWRASFAKMCRWRPWWSPAKPARRNWWRAGRGAGG